MSQVFRIAKWLLCACSNSGLSLEDFAALHNGCKRGDIVGVQGWPGKSKMGELSIFASRFVVLSYCLHMLPKRRLENQVVHHALMVIHHPACWA